ncbi:polysaccharide biosynthesis tyrosine autokinase [Gordonia sp. NPDC058843]|uniref:polysaccharide biosynthesis tyrosine autokinase n=1 Tax=Gordonia sp. NPDC058843 TaxID=3346648 RepID=UPI00369ED0F5
MEQKLSTEHTRGSSSADPLRRQLGVLRRGWWMLVGAALLGGCLALAGSLVQTPLYAASSTLYVSVQGGERSDAAYQNSMASQQRVLSYAKLINSDVIGAEVMERSGVGLSIPEIQSALTASYTPDTVLLTISAEDRDPAVAARLARAAAESVADYVSELERPVGGGDSLAKMTVVSPAQVSDTPVSPRVYRNTGVGLLIGAILGLGLLVLRNRLDSRLQDESGAVAASGAAVLGRIPNQREGSDELVPSFTGGWSSTAEAFRKLRTNLQYVEVDHPARIILVTSALEGDGKSTTCVNLCAALAEAGERVVLIDADLRRARVAAMLSASSAVGLTDYLRGDTAMADVVQQAPLRGFDLVASGSIPPNPAELLGSERFKSGVAELSSSYDYVIIDSPPVIPVTDAMVIAGCVDGVLVVGRVAKTRESALRSACDQLRSSSTRIIGILLNGVRNLEGSYQYSYTGAGAQPMTKK